MQALPWESMRSSAQFDFDEPCTGGSQSSDVPQVPHDQLVCFPNRVPVARLAAAQALLAEAEIGSYVPARR